MEAMRPTWRRGGWTSLDTVFEIVRGRPDSGLEPAADRAIALLQRQSTTTSDIASLTGAIPPLAEALRYGAARAMPMRALRLASRSSTPLAEEAPGFAAALPRLLTLLAVKSAHSIAHARHWRLVLGGDDQTGLSERDRRLDAARAGSTRQSLSELISAARS
jgi:hypothetical protein